MRAHSHDARSSRRGVAPAQVIVLGLVAAAVGWAAWLIHERPSVEEVDLLPGMMLSSTQLAMAEAAFDRAQLADHRCEDGHIWVLRPRQSAYMRALVDAEALPREFGSSLRRAIETNSPWQSRAAQEEHMRVAVQEELRHAICSMPGIEQAQVLYDIADQSGAGLASGPVRTASVSLCTQADMELEPTQAQAIRVLVASAIAGLEPERVAVTDLRSGRFYAGPIAKHPADREAAVDRDLARQAAHEKHLAAKVRQAIGFVKGAVVDVTVTFPPAAPPRSVEPVRHPERPTRPQRAAAANAPAEIGGDFAAVDAEADAAAAAAARAALEQAPVPAHDGPATIVVAIAVPETHFAAAVRAARDRDPAADPTAVEANERQRLAEHVRALLPATPRAEDRRVTITAYLDPRGREARPVVAVAVPAAPRAEPHPAVRRAAEIVGTARDALARGDLAAVPPEAWLVAAAGAALVLLVFALRRPAVDHDHHASRPRRRQPRIDWSTVDRGPHAADDPAEAPRVAA